MKKTVPPEPHKTFKYRLAPVSRLHWEEYVDPCEGGFMIVTGRRPRKSIPSTCFEAALPWEATKVSSELLAALKA
jgi:hypothetical protein